MTDRRPLEVDHVAQRREDFYFDPADRTITLVEEQDVTQIVEHAKRAYNRAADKHGLWRGEYVHMASIPVIFIHKLMQEGIISPGFKVLDPKRFQRWLNDHEAFKTTRGRAL